LKVQLIENADVYPKSFKKLAYLPNHLPAFSGVDVEINIFSQFRQFSAKKWAFFSKTNVMIQTLQTLAVYFGQKRQLLDKFFRRNYL
jgi:hypothetical protein